VPTRVRIALRLKPPLAAGLLGTDHFGRDVVSLLMTGAWNSLAIALPSVLIGAGIGCLIGCTAAALRGSFDAVALRIADVVFALPAVLSAIMIGVALQVWATDYVAAARAVGKHPLAIACGEVLPNIAGVLVVQLTIQLALAILTEAGLSYLGLGVRPPNPSWGRMLADSQTFLGQAPHLAIAPGLAIAVAVLGLNLLGDGLRDLLDPRMRGR
jgi:peptide/nickel transport system permease protein